MNELLLLQRAEVALPPGTVRGTLRGGNGLRKPRHAVNVRLAQIVRDRVDEIVIRVVREPGYGASDERVILKEARLRLGGDVNIRFEYVESIPRTKNGKHRFVLSSIKRPRIMGLEAPATDPGQRERGA